MNKLKGIGKLILLVMSFLFFSGSDLKADQFTFNPNNLPPCPKNINDFWNNCYGEARGYEGTWKDNKFDGRGQLLDNSGHVVYDGEFKNNYFHGNGILYLTKSPLLLGCQSDVGNCPQPIYVGEFDNGAYHGLGRLLNSFGESYLGEFQKRLYHGEGIRIDKSGDKYIGNFRSGQPFGRGALIKANGDKSEGIWENGAILKEEEINFLELEQIILKRFSQDEIIQWSNQVSRYKKPDLNKFRTTPNKEINTEDSINRAKLKCKELGFKEGSEKFGTCVLKISK